MILDLACSLVIPLLGLLALPVAASLSGRERVVREGPESLALGFGVALAWAMLGGMVLSTLGLLRPAAVGLWYGVGIFASLVAGRRSRFRIRAWLGSWRGWSPLLLMVAPLLLLLCLASVPPWYRDSLTYHLALPRFFAQHGGYAIPDQNLFAAFPLGWESALATLYGLSGSAMAEPPFNPRLFGAWTMAGAALAVLGLARSAGATRALSAGVAAVFLAIPSVVEFGASAYVEAALLLFTSLAFDSASRSLSSRREGLRIPWAAALWAGVAAWVKYPALAAVLALLFGRPFAEALSGRRIPQARERLRWIAWAALTLAIASPFLIRNLLVHHNPFFPTAYSLFGGEGWDPWRAWAYGETLRHYGYGREFGDYLALPLRLFSQRDFVGGFEGSLGPLVALGFLAGAGLLIARRGETRSRRVWGFLLGWSVGFSFFWAATVQQARFFLMGVPALLALLAAGASQVMASEALGSRSRLHSTRTLEIVGAVLLLAAQLQWAAPPLKTLWHRQHTSEYISGSKTREEVLASVLPESYPVMRELEEWVPPSGRIWLVWMRGYTYYLDRPYRVDSVFEAWRLEALLDEAPNRDAFRSALSRDGITHLLIHHRYFLANDNADLREGRTQKLRARFNALLKSGVLRPVRSWGPITLYHVQDERLASS